MTRVRVFSRHMFLIRPELGFLGELDDAFLVLLPGIPFAHGPSMPSLLPREVSVFVRAVIRKRFRTGARLYFSVQEHDDEIVGENYSNKLVTTTVLLPCITVLFLTRRR